jgi:hypothetical protein
MIGEKIMDMKDHLLAALKEQLNSSEEFLNHQSNHQINVLLEPSNWSTKDVLAHLRAWQQRSIARLEAALSDREPIFPKWLPEIDPELEVSTDQINAWIYETHRDESWGTVRQNWKDGFSLLLDLGERISERDMMDESRYTWMETRPLALILIGTYDHHREHLDQLLAWLNKHGDQ